MTSSAALPKAQTSKNYVAELGRLREATTCAARADMTQIPLSFA